MPTLSGHQLKTWTDSLGWKLLSNFQTFANYISFLNVFELHSKCFELHNYVLNQKLAHGLVQPWRAFTIIVLTTPYVFEYRNPYGTDGRTGNTSNAAYQDAVYIINMVPTTLLKSISMTFPDQINAFL